MGPHVIGFKTSRHSGQQFLTFRPAKVVYSYTGGQPYTPKSGQSIKAFGEYADYGDFLTFSETALTTYIDPVVAAAMEETIWLPLGALVALRTWAGLNS